MNKFFKYIATSIVFVMVFIPVSNVALAAKSHSESEGFQETASESVELAPSFKTIVEEENISQDELLRSKKLLNEKVIENSSPDGNQVNGWKLSTLKFGIKMAVKHNNLIPTKIARTYVKSYGNAILKALNTLTKASKSAMRGAFVQAGIPRSVASLLADVFEFLFL